MQERRESLKLTRAEVAERLQITVSALGKFEGGSRRPTRHSLPLIGDTLQISMEDLVKYWLGDKILELCKTEERTAIILALEYVQDMQQDIWFSKGEGDEIYPLSVKRNNS